MKNPSSEDMPESFRCNEDKIDKQIQFTVQPKVHKKVGGKEGGLASIKCIALHIIHVIFTQTLI